MSDSINPEDYYLYPKLLTRPAATLQRYQYGFTPAAKAPSTQPEKKLNRREKYEQFHEEKLKFIKNKYARSYELLSLILDQIEGYDGVAFSIETGMTILNMPKPTFFRAIRVLKEHHLIFVERIGVVNTFRLVEERITFPNTWSEINNHKFVSSKIKSIILYNEQDEVTQSLRSKRNYDLKKKNPFDNLPEPDSELD